MPAPETSDGSDPTAAATVLNREDTSASTVVRQQPTGAGVTTDVAVALLRTTQALKSVSTAKSKFALKNNLRGLRRVFVTCESRAGYVQHKQC